VLQSGGVKILNEVLPGGLDIGCIAVVCQVEDLQTNVIIAGRVGVLIEELGLLLVSELCTTRMIWTPSGGSGVKSERETYRANVHYRPIHVPKNVIFTLRRNPSVILQSLEEVVLDIGYVNDVSDLLQ